jgi:predicted Zn-dependent protease with MMP-like domain
MDRAKFERVVNEAVQQLPAEFRSKLDNVAVIVDDCPSEELLERMDIPEGDTLLGLYEGTPLTDRGFETPLHPESGSFKSLFSIYRTFPSWTSLVSNPVQTKRRNE